MRELPVVTTSSVAFAGSLAGMEMESASVEAVCLAKKAQKKWQLLLEVLGRLARVHKGH